MIDAERIPTPRFQYATLQRTRDTEYASAYPKWLASLSPSERAKIEEMGLGQADTAERTCNTVRDFDEGCADEIVHSDPEQSPIYRQAMAEMFAELCHWFVLPPGQRGINAKAIGCRVIMAMWVLRPDVIGNLSQTEIATLVGTKPEVLSRQATAFSKNFGIRGRSQFSEKTRKAQSASATAERALRQQGGEIHGRN